MTRPATKRTPTTRFPLGRTLTTPGALAALLQAGESPLQFLARHARGDWGDLEAVDKREDDPSLKNGFRLLSAYKTRLGEKLWVITEADRSATTILLPSEY